jgi:hypothetical protein
MRLSEVTGLSSLQLQEETMMDMKHFWIRVNAKSGELKPHVQFE